MGESHSGINGRNSETNACVLQDFRTRFAGPHWKHLIQFDRSAQMFPSLYEGDQLLPPQPDCLHKHNSPTCLSAANGAERKQHVCFQLLPVQPKRSWTISSCLTITPVQDRVSASFLRQDETSGLSESVHTSQSELAQNAAESLLLQGTNNMCAIHGSLYT